MSSPKIMSAAHPTALRWQEALAATPVRRALLRPAAAVGRTAAWPLRQVLPPALPHGPLVYLALDENGAPRYAGRTVQPLADRIARHRRERPMIAQRWRWVLAAEVTPGGMARAEEWIRLVFRPPDNRMRAAGWSRAVS